MDFAAVSNNNSTTYAVPETAYDAESSNSDALGAEPGVKYRSEGAVEYRKMPLLIVDEALSHIVGTLRFFFAFLTAISLGYEYYA